MGMSEYDIKLDDAVFLELLEPIDIYWVRHTRQCVIELYLSTKK